MRRFFRASGSRGDDPDVPGDANEGKYHVGERWNYRTRLGEEGSSLTILKVESLPKVGMTVHVSVDGLRIENPSAPGGVSERIGHMPFTEAAIDLSVTTRAAAEITVPPTTRATRNGVVLRTPDARASSLSRWPKRWT
jgi:hypothetical protein